ncbi:sulfotransferase family protein [Nocardioides sp. AX2bis]|uniref:sulfotransferase family protein n=1 Tax=Nocardioides sp. AX2bis TaxID=2653157 RepID=UPI0012F23A1D|nr:sulfotransferase family protein [Nocardioides sp. AX2bis]VXC22496.1 conserved hypothetical protein [Nocardioides sp. AX2bis]
MTESQAPAVLLVAGAGRSGTSTFAGLARVLGLSVPQPEVGPDPSNPRGFSEPQWVVDLHERLLRGVGVQVADARPSAWWDAAEVCTDEAARIRVAGWLEEQLAPGTDLVLKDPRLGWFVPLWRAAALRVGARPVLATVVRAPGEVVASRQTHYGDRLGAAHLAAGWLNMQLHVERATRCPVGEDAAGPRVLVRYADLLEDWVRATTHVGRVLDLVALREPTSERVRDGHRFVDPSLHRTTTGLGELDLPASLRELVEETWTELDLLAGPGADGPEAHARLDELRAAYVDLYSDAEAVTRSSVLAARRDRRPPTPPDAGPHTADTVPHGLRAMVPGPVRRGLRRAVGRPR